jgi:hypothetical protein
LRSLGGFRQAATVAATVAMHVLLVLLFYAAVAPLALLLRVLGIDVIGSRPNERATSYWRDIRAPRHRRKRT